MWLVQSRSSRLFLVLLHLTGVSKRLPQQVQPSAIVLERVDPNTIQHSQQERERIREKDEAQASRTTSSQTQTPSDEHTSSSSSSASETEGLIWLQDTSLGRCLTPLASLADCGDATLWRLVPRPRPIPVSHKRWLAWALEEFDHAQASEEYYKLVLEPQPPRYALEQDGDCLAHLQDRPSMVPCNATNPDNKNVWTWQLDTKGVLSHYKPTRKERRAQLQKAKRRRRRRTSPLMSNSVVKGNCMAMNSTTELFMESCSNITEPVRFALVRQASSSDASVTPTSIKESASSNEQLADIPDTISIPTHRNGLGNADTSSHHSSKPENLSSGPTLHPDLKKPSRLLFSSRSNGKATERASAIKEPSKRQHNELRPQLQFLKNAHPILLIPNYPAEVEDDPEANDLDSDKPHRDDSVKKSKKKKMTAPPEVGSIRQPKIQMIHPYIASSQNEVWTDPQTGLEYPTDLHEYLGHERRESGRHTLTGVGLYMRTMLKIKIYGIAHYVSKRDLLADPSMEAFAGLSATELRNRPDFFKTLRHMKAPGFDRTLFIKTNMQLGTDTMRSSLEADWKKLTADSKSLMINSSLKPRALTDRMRKVVEDSKNNQGRCSCAQIPPEGYDADPSCCARGTELAFTWRKNGDMEIRLNGDFMDSFPRPDIASGIFYEYFRLDDPMSFDFLDHVVDGFPFLLAPLARVKGVTAGMPQASIPKQSESLSTTSNPLFKAFTSVNDVVSSQAMNLAGSLQSGATEVSTRAINTVQYVGGAARNLGEQVDKRRVMVASAVSSFVTKNEKSMTVVLPNFRSSSFDGSATGNDDEPEPLTLKDLLYRLIRGSAHATMSDEIVPMTVQPSDWSHWLFFGIVHLYLFLLLVASFPTAELPTHAPTRLKSSSDSSSMEFYSGSDTDSSDSYEVTPRTSPPTTPPGTPGRFRYYESLPGKDRKIKKSLSYVL